jgi:DNA (cytosine-5)-methyltransferase 1
MDIAGTLTAPEYRKTLKDGKRQDGSRQDRMICVSRSRPTAQDETTTPDSPRYKALGNAVAVPVIKWIGDRLRRFE